MVMTSATDIYIFGGQTSSDLESCVNTTYHFNITSNTWTAKADIPKKRAGCSAIVSGAKVYIFGGYSGNGLRTTQISVYDSASDKFAVCSYRLPLGFYGAAMAWNNKNVLLIGGYRVDGSSRSV